jgi:hypothetical protein
VVNVRVDDPAVAVMVTPVAFALCQFSVTGCPEVIEVELALRVTVGGVGVGGGDFATPLEHPIKPANMRDTTPTPMKQKGLLLMLLVRGSDTRTCAKSSDAGSLCSVAAKQQVR